MSPPSWTRRSSRGWICFKTFVEQVFRRCVQVDRRASGLGEGLVQLLQVRPIAGRLAHEHLFAGEVFEGRESGRGRPSHYDLGDPAVEGVGEVDFLHPVFRDREDARDEVALAGQQGRDQLLGRRRNHADMNQDVLARFCIALAELLLELAQQLVDGAHLLAPVDPVFRAGGSDKRANHAPLDHRVQIAGERLRDAADEALFRRRRGRDRRADRKQAGFHRAPFRMDARAGAYYSTASATRLPTLALRWQGSAQLACVVRFAASHRGRAAEAGKIIPVPVSLPARPS